VLGLCRDKPQNGNVTRTVSLFSEPASQDLSNVTEMNLLLFPLMVWMG